MSPLLNSFSSRTGKAAEESDFLDAEPVPTSSVDDFGIAAEGIGSANPRRAVPATRIEQFALLTRTVRTAAFHETTCRAAVSRTGSATAVADFKAILFRKTGREQVFALFSVVATLADIELAVSTTAMPAIHRTGASLEGGTNAVAATILRTIFAGIAASVTAFGIRGAAFPANQGDLFHTSLIPAALAAIRYLFTNLGNARRPRFVATGRQGSSGRTFIVIAFVETGIRAAVAADDISVVALFTMTCLHETVAAGRRTVAAIETVFTGLSFASFMPRSAASGNAAAGVAGAFSCVAKGGKGAAYPAGKGRFAFFIRPQ